MDLFEMWLRGLFYLFLAAMPLAFVAYSLITFFCLDDHEKKDWIIAVSVPIFTICSFIFIPYYIGVFVLKMGWSK